MAYSIKATKYFQRDLNIYLQKHPLELNYEEKLINNFSSHNLSDLYLLFLNLKDLSLNSTLYDKLKVIIKTNFNIDFSFNKNSDSLRCITKEDINWLENIIKNTYMDYISNGNGDISEDELYNLSLIVNKIFPEVFLQFIQKSDSNITTQQKIIKDKFTSTIMHNSLHNTKEAEEENRDIIGALYITARKLYPHFNIYIPGRVKSTRSSVINVSKEVEKGISSLIPSNLSQGLSTSDVENQFDLCSANTDFSGLTIVLVNTDDTLHFDRNDPKSAEILKFRKFRNDCIYYTHSLENFLSENDCCHFSYLELLQIKIELLIKLRESTYEECSKEYKGTSFTEFLKLSLKDYRTAFYNPILMSEEEYTTKLDEIYELLDELRKRVHDKYQAKLLERAIPDILNDKIFSDTLKVKSYFVKNVRKNNGFCSLYYTLETSDGRKIELQAQSKKRYEDSKNGSSDHSLLPNKDIDITHFFEPADSDCSQKYFEDLLNTFNNTPIAIKNFLFRTSDSELSSTQVRLKRKLKLAEQNIKLKDHFEFKNILSNGTVINDTFSLETILIMFAEYISPKSIVASSPHTRFHKSVAGYFSKSIISSFSQVLLKHDSTTCLAQMLIDKLEEILPNDKNEISLNGINKRAAQRFGYLSSNLDNEGR